MSNQTTKINIRMDEKLKQQFDVLCNELGMNMTTAFNIFAKAMVRQHGIPFNVTLDIPNETTLAAMDAAEHGQDMYGPYNSVEALMEALNA